MGRVLKKFTGPLGGALLPLPAWNQVLWGHRGVLRLLGSQEGEMPRWMDEEEGEASQMR